MMNCVQVNGLCQASVRRPCRQYGSGDQQVLKKSVFYIFNFLPFDLGNFQSAFHKSRFVIYAQFHPCFHDEIFLYILMTGFWLQPLLDYSWPISSINIILKISPFSASSFLRAPLTSTVNSMAIDIYLKLTNLMLLLSSSKLFPLNAQVEDWRGALQKRLKALKLIRSCVYLILFKRQINTIADRKMDRLKTILFNAKVIPAYSDTPLL